MTSWNENALYIPFLLWGGSTGQRASNMDLWWVFFVFSRTKRWPNTKVARVLGHHDVHVTSLQCVSLNEHTTTNSMNYINYIQNIGITHGFIFVLQLLCFCIGMYYYEYAQLFDDLPCIKCHLINHTQTYVHSPARRNYMFLYDTLHPLSAMNIEVSGTPEQSQTFIFKFVLNLANFK